MSQVSFALGPMIRWAVKEPSAKEREQNVAAGHVPYRSWCRACIAGKGRRDPHYRDKGEKAAVLALDYGYMEPKEEADEMESTAAPILIGRCARTKMTFAEVLPSKGLVHPYNLVATLRMVKTLGYHKLILKTDGEEAILALVRATAAEARVRHQMDVTLEMAPDKESNGLAEGAVKDVKAEVRTLTFDVSERYGVAVKARHVLMPWLVKHAATSINLGQLGPDGHTPWERLRGRKFQKLMLPIAETIMYHTGAAPSRHEGRWQTGIFLGLADKNEFYIGVEGKVITARSVRRLPPSEYSNAELLNKVQGPEVVDPAGLPDMQPPQEIRRARTYIRKDVELRDHGYTAHCPGCEAARLNLTPRGHSEACRQRIERAMEATGTGQERLKATKAKMDLREGSTVEKRGNEGLSDSLEPDLSKARGSADGPGVGSAQSASASSAMETDVRHETSFREKRRQQEMQEMEILLPRTDTGTKKVRTTEDTIMSDLRVVLSRLVWEITCNDRVLDLRGLRHGEENRCALEGVEHVILQWSDSTWQREVAKEQVQLGKILHVIVDTSETGTVADGLDGKEGLTFATHECGQFDVVH
eukprot:6470753-Amphidinium_carterae.1